METPNIKGNTSRSEIDKHIDVLLGKVNKFLSQDKPPDVLIIKAHLICEYYLTQILIVKEMATAGQIDKMTFFDKLGKALNTADAQEKNLHEKLIRLNRLRNKAGHELEYSLSESDVDNLGYLNGKKYVLDKYDRDNQIEVLLRDTLVGITISVSMLLFNLVDKEKSKAPNSKL